MRTNLGNLFNELHSGESIKASNIKDAGTYPVYGGNGLRGYTEKYNAEGDYIIIGRQGAYCGNVRYHSGRAFLTEHAILGKPKQDVNPVFLSYYLNSLGLYRYQGQSAQPGLAVGTIATIDVNVPDSKVQEKIGKFIIDLDRKIALNRKMNSTLEAMAKQLYDYWFVQFDFPNSEGKPYKSSGGKMVWNEKLKREIPEDWEVKKLTETTTDKMESINPSDNPKTLYKHYSIPAFDKCESYDLERGCDILSNKYIPTSGDVLVSKLNPWTSRVIWGVDSENTICSTEFVSLAPNKIEEKGFVYFLAKSTPFINYCTKASTGTSHSHRRVNPEIMKMFAYPYDEKVIFAYSSIVTRYANMIMKNLEEIRKLSSLRDYLLPLLMNGQVTIKEKK